MAHTGTCGTLSIALPTRRAAPIAVPAVFGTMIADRDPVLERGEGRAASGVAVMLVALLSAVAAGCGADDSHSDAADGAGGAATGGSAGGESAGSPSGGSGAIAGSGGTQATGGSSGGSIASGGNTESGGSDDSGGATSGGTSGDGGEGANDGGGGAALGGSTATGGTAGSSGSGGSSPGPTCPQEPPTDGDACDGSLSCFYDDCPDGHRTSAGCVGGVWSVETGTSCTVRCTGPYGNGMTCQGGEVCLVSVGGTLNIMCLENGCGSSPVSASCAGNCPVTSSLDAGVTVTCNTCTDPRGCA